jgi:hypothetical protein
MIRMALKRLWNPDPQDKSNINDSGGHCDFE